MTSSKQALWVGAIAIVAVLALAFYLPQAQQLLAAIGLMPHVAGHADGSRGNGAAQVPVGAGPGQNGARREVLVEAAAVHSATINDRIAAIGNGEALRSVAVVPLTSGVVTELLVRAGDRVSAGQVLARLDSGSEQIERDRAALAVQGMKDKVARTERLASSRAASEVALGDARIELETTRLALREAELKLARRTIAAPISGVAGIVAVALGAYITNPAAIVTIDDRSALLVDFWVPERFAVLVKTGQQVEASPLAVPGSTVLGVVSEMASRVEPASRTIQIRARISNEGDNLRPGMSFQVVMRFAGEQFPAVDPLAIQWSSAGAFVWKIDTGTALRVPVRIIQRNSDHVLVSGALASGDNVVTQGVQNVREGAPLRIASEANEPQDGGT